MDWISANEAIQFLSALPPSLRPAWAASMARLLSPTGRLICLEFPSNKEPSTGGPPWALPPNVYLGHLGRPGEQIEYDEQGYIKLEHESLVGRGGLERIAHWKPERTHEIGKGQDWESIWKHVK